MYIAFLARVNAGKRLLTLYLLWFRQCEFSQTIMISLSIGEKFSLDEMNKRSFCVFKVNLWMYIIKKNKHIYSKKNSKLKEIIVFWWIFCRYEIKHPTAYENQRKINNKYTCIGFRNAEPPGGVMMPKLNLLSRIDTISEMKFIMKSSFLWCNT